MSDDVEVSTPSLSGRAEARAAARSRRLKRAKRREACFDLFVSGFPPHEIARAMKMSPASIRRLIDQAIRERRLDAPDDYARVQVARLSKALCMIDHRIEQGDFGSVAPLIRLVAELDRYHGLGQRYQRLAPPTTATRRSRRPALAAARPLALTHDRALLAATVDLAGVIVE